MVLRRKLRRGKVLAFFAGLPSCLVGMEACASAHYWARELQALGHKVRLIPPQYVRPFVKTNKNDAADAEAICEAVTRPTMRFAPAKSAEQQSVLMLHRARELLVRQRTMVINALRGHCAELGLIVAQGASRVEELVAIIEDPGDERLPPLAREALGSLVEQLCSAQARIKQLEATLMAWHRSNQASRRLATIPGVGVITATALVATIGDGAQFRSGRQLSAWLGLVPRQHSSGGKDRRRPAGAVGGVAPGDAAQFDGVEQERPDVDIFAATLCRDLLCDHRFCRAGRPPDHSRLAGPRSGGRGSRRVRSGGACSPRKWLRVGSWTGLRNGGEVARAPSGRPASPPSGPLLLLGLPWGGRPAPPVTSWQNGDRWFSGTVPGMAKAPARHLAAQRGRPMCCGGYGWAGLPRPGVRGSTGRHWPLPTGGDRQAGGRCSGRGRAGDGACQGD